MSIESSGAAVTPRPADAGGAVAARTQRGGAGAHGPSDAPSFLSLLLSLEPQAQAQALVGDPPPAADAGDDPQTLAMQPDPLAMLAQNQGHLARQSRPDSAFESGQELPGLKQERSDPAMLAGQELVPVALPSPATAELAHAPGAAPSGAHLSGSLVEQVAGKRAPGDPGSQLSAGDAPGVSMHTATALDLNNDEAAGPIAALPVPDPMRGNTRTSRQAQAGDHSISGTAALGQTEQERLVVDGAKVDAQAGLSTMLAAGAASVGGLAADAGGASGKGLTGLRGGDRPGARPILPPAAVATAGAWADLQLGGGIGGGIVFAPDASVALPQEVVAQKVSYWISRGVQNAELKLDAFGGAAVDVSISVQGNEAMVEFRSDQPEARKLLAGAMPHLRELLERQGLALAGGFVGTSARDEPGTRERNGNAPATRGSLVGVEIPAAGATPAPSRGPGRVVDLFV